MSDSIRKQLALQDTHLQYLTFGHHGHGRQWLNTDDATACPELAARMAFHLKTEPTAAQLAACEPAQAAAWRGWMLFYQGRFMAAEPELIHAWRALPASAPDTALECDIALGLGRLYTRSGHWRQAMGWLLAGLRLARGHGRQFDIIRCYGALGELLLRAGYPHQAQLYLATSCHLLPPGSGQRPRQLNYLASALMRNGDLYKAESLLMTSLFMAVDEQDNESLWHSLARLQILHLRQADCGYADARQALNGELPAPVPIATAMYHLARAALLQASAPESARHELAQAAELTGGRFPVEHAWSRRSLAALDRAHAGSFLPAEATRLTCHTAPAARSVLDADLTSLALPPHNGFDWLDEPARPDRPALSLFEFDAFFF